MVWPQDINPELDKIQRQLNAAREAEPIAQPFESANVTLDTDLTELKNSCGCHIYIFKLTDEGANAADVRNTLLQQKQGNPQKKYPKVNPKPSMILYVGSSRGAIYRRVLQHLGACPDATYALKLNDWFRCRVTLHVRNYGNIESNVLQIIEDCIAQRLQPMFGKQGGNGR